jgi:hypothetical protein
LEWLTSPIDPDRAHQITQSVAWHGRTMVLAWAVLAPLAIIIARFFKILPQQDWPRELDSAFWWRSHWIGQMLAVVLTIAGFTLVLPADIRSLTLHSGLGYLLFAGLLAQVLLGIFRGSKGGPTSPAPDGSPRGHHYDMTPWRLWFEMLHKTLGYGLCGLAVIIIIAGLWQSNAPNWMWIVITLWWLILIGAFIHLQRRGLAIDTYQAIWGDDLVHPGNQRPDPGWGVRRPGKTTKEATDVRDD